MKAGEFDQLVGDGMVPSGDRLVPGGARSIDTRTPEELAEAGITIRVDENGKRHITMRADPIVWLRDGPKTVACGYGCGAEVTFTQSGPTGGWIPPHPGRDSWTCPACRGQLKPLRVTKEGVV